MKKVTGIFAAVLLCLLVFRLDVAGAAQAIEVDLDEARSDCIFQVKWEESDAKASVKIISPSGEIYGTGETPDQATVMQGAVYIYIGDAEAGEWTVQVTGDSLGDAEVTVGSLPQSMKVDLFTVTENGNGNYHAAWTISDCPEDVSVRIYANRSKEGYDGTEVSGVGQGPVGAMDFAMPDLDSGYYYFYVSVTADSGAFNYGYADTPFFFDNEGRPEKLSSVTAGLLDGDVYMSWEGEAGTYRVMLFDPDTGELLASEITEDTTCLAAMPEGSSKVLAAAASYDYERLGRFDLYEVSAEQAVDASVTFPEESATNQAAVYADVVFSGSCTVSATLNGEVMLQDSVEQGKYSIELEEGDNTVIFLVTDEKGNTAAFLKELYLDSIAPQLSMKRNLSGVTTDDSYIYVEGYTEAGAALTCNGQEVELTGSYFSYKQPLSYGKNEIQVVAKDIAGNETRYTAAVKRPFWSMKFLKWIILGAAAVVLIIIETMVLVRGKRRSRR